METEPTAPIPEQGPNPNNPATAMYYFVQGLAEFADASRLESAGEANEDAETIFTGRQRKAKAFELMDQATKLNRQLHQHLI